MPNLRELLTSSSAEDLTMEELALNTEAMGWMFFQVAKEKDDDSTFLMGSGEGVDSYPRMFIDADALHESTTLDVDVETESAYQFRSEQWLSALMRLWAEGAPGVVLDAGDQVAVELDRNDIRGLITAFAAEWFVEPSELAVVMNDGRVHYSVGSAGQKLAYAFSFRTSSDDELAHLQTEGSTLVGAPVDAGLLLEGTLSAGVDRLIVDSGLPNQHGFSRANLETLRDIRLESDSGICPVTADSFLSENEEKIAPVTQAEAPTPTDESAPEPLFESKESLSLLEVDEETADFLDALVPTDEEIEASSVPSSVKELTIDEGFEPRRNEHEAHARLLQIKALVDAEPEQAWRATESFAMDFDMWVPFARTDSEKLWPSTEISKNEAGEPRPCVCIYTSEEEGRRSLARKSQPFELMPLASLEAFRWIWSSPECPEEIMIDPFGEGGGVQLHRNSLVSMLFPSILDVKELALVPELPFDKLADLPWTHGLKPEVIRAFVMNWRTLLGPPLTGAQSTVEYRGKHYLPVFSTEDHYRDYVRFSGNQIARPLRPITNPPFMNWLRLSGRCEGLVLDPPTSENENANALTLDAVELFHLQLWARTMQQPEGSLMVDALARLQRGDYSAEQGICGRIAADWPLYYAAVLRKGDEVSLAKVPETDELALFTGERELAEFKRTFRTKNPALDDLESHQMLPRWRANFFRLANQNYSGVCLNPGSSSEPHGVQLDGKGLDGAIERLEMRLRPRIPGFE